MQFCYVQLGEYVLLTIGYLQLADLNLFDFSFYNLFYCHIDIWRGLVRIDMLSAEAKNFEPYLGHFFFTVVTEWSSCMLL